MADNGKRERSSGDMAAMIDRCLRAMVKRAAEGDIEAVARLEDIGDMVRAAQIASVAALTSEPNPYSWAHIAGQLGITRQGAMRRFPSVTSGRTVGGQPGHLR